MVVEGEEEGIDDDDEDEARFQADIKRAIKESERQAQVKTGDTRTASSSTPAPAPQPQTTSSFASERAQMEKERLERLKRRRPDLHQQVNTVVLGDDSDNEEEYARGAKRQHISSSQSGARRANASASSSSTTTQTATARARPAAATASGSASAAQTLFWDGELRQTANMHVDRQKDTRPLFRLTEILAPVGLVCFGQCIQPD